MNKEKPIVIYTDGSYDRKSNCGGWAYIILDIEGNELLRSSTWITDASCIRAEVLPVIHGVHTITSYIEDITSILIMTDCKYVQNTINNYIHKWPNRDWKTVKNNEIKHRDLWEPFLEYIKRYNIRSEWVKAHNGDKYNELVNSMAINEMEKLRRGL